MKLPVSPYRVSLDGIVEWLRVIVTSIGTSWNVEHTGNGRHTWRLTTIPFNAGNFTGDGSMTWTVDTADQGTYSYAALGDMMWLTFALRDTDVGGTASTYLRVALPAGYYVGAAATCGTLQYSDAGGALAMGLTYAVPGERWVRLYTATAGNWTLTTSDNTDVYGTIMFPVMRG